MSNDSLNNKEEKFQEAGLRIGSQSFTLSPFPEQCHHYLLDLRADKARASAKSRALPIFRTLLVWAGAKAAALPAAARRKAAVVFMVRWYSCCRIARNYFSGREGSGRAGQSKHPQYLL